MCRQAGCGHVGVQPEQRAPLLGPLWRCRTCMLDGRNGHYSDGLLPDGELTSPATPKPNVQVKRKRGARRTGGSNSEPGAKLSGPVEGGLPRRRPSKPSPRDDSRQAATAWGGRP